MAEGLMRRGLGRRGIGDVDVRSAGVAAWDEQTPSPEAVIGAPLEHLRAGLDLFAIDHAAAAEM